jgi:predicted N-acyltransferase
MVSRQGRIVGALLCFHWERKLYADRIGIDYVAAGDAFEYFNLGYYDTVRYALDNEYTQVVLGMATYRAKLVRGARLEPLCGIAQSRRAAIPMLDPRFAAWDRARRSALRQANPELMRRTQLP